MSGFWFVFAFPFCGKHKLEGTTGRTIYEVVISKSSKTAEAVKRGIKLSGYKSQLVNLAILTFQILLSAL